MDFEEAFDIVRHRRSISKLYLYGVNSRIILWITEFLDKNNLELQSMANIFHSMT